MKFPNKLAGLALSGAALVGGSVAALAYGAWTSSGSGTATDGATSVAIEDSAISLSSAAGAAAADLWPGRSVSLKVNVTNPNPYPVVVTSVGGGASDALTDCAAGTLSTNTLTGSAVAQSGGGTVIAATGSADYTLTVTMSSSAARACAGQTFTVSGLSASLQQSGA